jgi:hypothetical protein
MLSTKYFIQERISCFWGHNFKKFKKILSIQLYFKQMLTLIAKMMMIIVSGLLRQLPQIQQVALGEDASKYRN